MALSFLAGALLVGLVMTGSGSGVGASPVADRLADLGSVERNTVEVFQRVSPAVVHVYNIGMRRALYSREIFEVPQGQGTGFVWDKQGHIVTNWHVVNGNSAISVSFADGTSSRATLIGRYANKDIAVLRVERPVEKLTPVDLGTSEGLLVGQSVLAIGNPFGLDQTLTTGIVSSLGQEIRALTGRPIQDVIQTDAAINPGNSGGPLLDSRGRMIGVNTAILSPTGTSAGIGYAIPIDTVKSVVGQIIEKGRFMRPGLGIELYPESVTRRWGIDGVVIAAVPRLSAAAKSGLRGTAQNDDGDVVLGDAIVAIDGKKVASSEEIYRIFDRYKVGDEVEISYRRGTRAEKTRVKLQPIEDEPR